MAQGIHYMVEVLLCRSLVDTRFDEEVKPNAISDPLIFIRREFKNDSPLVARKEAFVQYQLFINALYEGMDKTPSTDQAMRNDLRHYFDDDIADEALEQSSHRFKPTDELYPRVDVYMIIDRPLKKSKDLSGTRVLLHGIGLLDYLNPQDESIPLSVAGLIKEFRYYEENEYTCKNYVTRVDFEKIGGNVESILRTPFNWEAFIDSYKVVANDKKMVGHLQKIN